MNILMVSNTYLPIVGGLEKSIQVFTREYRKAGHRAVILAPVYEDQPPQEKDVARVPALLKFNHTDFSVWVPLPGVLHRALGDFRPDLIHAHHPFLLGGAAVRLAAAHRCPLVFTYHTMYEQNTYYVPGDSVLLRQFVAELAAGYSNLCDQVIAPSRSIADLLRERGVETPIEVIPTGIELDRFRVGDGRRIREQMQIPERAFVVGHLGRIAPEKNVAAVAGGVAEFLARRRREPGRRPQAHFLVVGDGPSLDEVKAVFAERKLSRQLHCTGTLHAERLVDAYHAMDVFAFASPSETQGLVLVEAMAAGVPVLGVDANAVRDIIRDGVNGRLLADDAPETFASALEGYAGLPALRKRRFQAAARETAEPYSVSACTGQALRLYEEVIRRGPTREDRSAAEGFWAEVWYNLEGSWKRFANLTRAAVASVDKVIIEGEGLESEEGD